MLIKAVQTFVSRIFIAAASLALVVLSSRLLGPEGRGEISLITMAMALIMLGNDFLAGSSLVYFSSRKNLWSLLLPAYLWAIILCAIAVPALYYSGFIASEHVLSLALASLFFCWLSANYSVMLGRKLINQRNMIQALLPLLQLIIFWMIFVPGYGVTQYVTMLNSSIAACLFFSLIIIFPFISSSTRPDYFYNPEHFKFGAISQLGNIVIFLAYRFNFKVIDYFEGKDELGVYSTAVMLGESLLMITQSIATVQMAHLVNSDDDGYRLQLTLRNFRLAAIVLPVAALVLALLPESFYLMLFGGGFAETRNILLLFLPAVIFLGMSSILSHYYAGTARFKILLKANALCLLLVVSAGMILVPLMGTYGAALAQSLGYGALLLFYIVIFCKEKMISPALLLPDRSFYADLSKILRGGKKAA